MYSHEIKELLKLKRNIVNVSEYLCIVSSPQVNHIQYINGKFDIWTKDGYKFELILQDNRK